MKNRFTLFVATLLVCASSFAQWVKPAAPASTPLAVGEECYLYNKEADGFLLGANEWGTRASVSATLGHKVYIQNGTIDGSYYITNYVLQGGMQNQIGYMFVDGFDAIYVDNTIYGKTNNQYTFEAQGDGTYKIGLSAANETFKPSDFPGAYLGINTTKVGDTRLYFCDPENPDGYTMDQCQIIWYFVTPAAYTAYVAAIEQYEAAVELGKVIDKAVAAGVDATAAKAVYDNTSSTAEQLKAARVALAEAVQNAGFNAASVENPFTVLFYDFENKDASDWTSTTSAQNKGADNGNNAADYAVTGIHYENWNNGNFTVGGTISATAKDMPVGVYHLSALAFTNTGTGVNLFADKGKAPVTATNININEPTDVYTFLLEKQNLEFGLQVEANKMNWVGLDNVKLEYLGTSAEAYKYVVDLAIKNAPAFDESDYCQKSLYEAYTAAKEALIAATEPAAMAVAIDAFDAASAALAPSVEAYKAYTAKLEEAMTWLDSAKQNEEVDYLSDYVNGDESPVAGEYNGNGTAVYILENGLLDVAQITAEAAFLDKLLMTAMAAGMSDGDDCTDIIKNAAFTSNEAWSKGLCNFNLGPDGAKVAEGFNIAFDVNQTLTGLQNGLYELTLNGFCRNAGYDKPEYTTEEAGVRAYVYMNSFETKLPQIETGAVAEVSDDIKADCAEREGIGFVPNGVNSASAAFQEGRYAVKLYALVTDGTMKIGIRNDLRYEDSWVCWSGLKLTFRAKNADALASVIASQTPIANAMLDNYAGQTEINALSAAIENAKSAENDDLYDAFKAMKIAMDEVTTGTELYAELNTSLAALKDAIENNTKADASTVAMAQGVYDDAKAAYDAKSYDNAAADAAIAEVSAATVSVKMGKINASEDNPVNFTSAIVNNNFDPARGSKDAGTIEGWVTTPMNGYKQNSVSYNRAAFELNQTISGLPKGKYKVTVHTYYRAGYWDEEEAHMANGENTHLTTLYAQTSAGKATTPVMNLTEGAVKETELPENCGNTYTLSSGLRAPDGTSPTVAFFNAGYYLNELRFEVPEDGQVTIGLSKTEVYPNDYEVVGAWELWYMGDGGAAVKDTVDVTDYITNNNFDPARGSKDAGTIEGWVTTPMNGYKQNSVSYNRAAFELNQTVKGLEPGRYLVTVHTYYRAGYWDEEEAHIANGENTHLTTLYAQTSADKYSTPVMNLTEGAVKETELPENCGNTYTLSSGLRAPDGTSPTVAFFNAGYYLNKLEFVVPADGQVTIGLSKSEVYPNDYEVVGEWRLYRLPDASAITEEDYTDFIVNPTFDPARGSKDAGTIEGWVTTPMNGYKQNSASYNRAAFELNQTIKGLPEGTYKVTVHTYYRAGYWDEEEAHMANGEDTHLTTLYAQTADNKYSVPVMNLTEGAVKETELPENCGNTYTLSSGLRAPDGTSPTVAFFNAGYYLNELPFYVGNDGTVTIGLSKKEIFPNDYEVVGAWHLYYYGSGNNVEQIGGATAVEAIDVAPIEIATPVAYYSVSGAKLDAPQKGINIVKMSNNTVIKILVK
ncbi:MAG: hypothetical protein MJZ36_06740 [Bacteroidaceae bacterium]|nr:hypothetical protein [Bacteroidaceae bacterium]